MCAGPQPDAAGMTQGNIMRKHLVFLAVLLAFMSLAQAKGLSKEVLNRRNAAASYAGTVKFAVGRAARTCRDVLGKDDQYMRAIADEWTQRNLRYASSAERWLTVLVATINEGSGREAALEARDKLVGHIQNEGMKSAIRLVGTEPAMQKERCEKFPALVSSGSLDITEKAPLYKELQELAALFERPPTPRPN